MRRLVARTVAAVALVGALVFGAVRGERQVEAAGPQIQITNHVKIAFLGDSISAPGGGAGFTWWYSLRDLLLGKGIQIEARPYGYPFQELSIIATHTQDALASVPDVLFVEGGTNDILHSIALGTSTTNLDLILSTARTARPSMPIFVLSIFSIGSEQFQTGAFLSSEPTVTNMNAMIATEAALWGATYVDTRSALAIAEALHNTPAPGASTGIYTTDAVHPNAAGQALMGVTALNAWLAVATLVPGTPDSSIAWLKTRRARATTLGASGAYEWNTDILDGRYGSTSIGAGQVTISSTLPAGVAVVNTNGSGGSIILHPVSKPVQCANLLTCTAYGYWRVRFENADANTKELACLMSTTLSDTPASACFGIVGTGFTGGSNTNFVTTTNPGGAADTVTATATVVENAAYHDVEVAAVAGVLTWYLDGVQKAQQTLTSGLVGVSTAAMVTARNRNGGDATSRNLDVDRMMLSL